LGYAASCFEDVKDSREFKLRIQQFATALRPKSEVLFYYAGHAIQVKGESYLVPVSARLRAEADVAIETVPLGFIMTQLLQAKHYVNIMILDACRSNPWGSNPRGMSTGLAPITATPRGTMIMYGTATNDVSDDGEGRNGTLTKNLLANIRLPGLTADEFFKRVSEGVQSDSTAAVGHTQTPALYTNFAGEFCFAGCIDRVARAELERIQKTHQEQLEKARRETAALEASDQAAQAQLTAITASMYCNPSETSLGERCFVASSDKITLAIETAFRQRGLTISYPSRQIVGLRSTDDPKDKHLTDVLSVTATIKELAATQQCNVTITAKQQVLLHDERHHWTTADLIIPIPTSTDYKQIVKQDVDVKDPAFFGDLYAAIEQNLRGDAALKTFDAPPSEAVVTEATQ
jgi:hypothetical protein